MTRWPKQTQPSSRRKAKAPYNFVRLPEMIPWTPQDPPAMDRYHEHDERYTGHLTCTLTTASPLYVRCGVTPAEAKAGSEAKDRPDFFYTDPHTRNPVIPGASLRGMLRTLVEIVSYSKVQPVTDQARMTFRAVARQKPLDKPYEEALGKYGKKVKAGYVQQRGDRWYIQPAHTPRSVGLPEKKAYLTVKDHQVREEDLPGFIPFNHPDYQPQYHRVGFDAEIRHGKRGKYVWVANVAAPDVGGECEAMLVGTGNMAETADDASKTPRKRYALVLPPNRKAQAIPIAEQAVEDYRASLTDFQTEPPFDKRTGCLVPDRPIFYVEEQGEVIAFGHCPNFRIPAWLSGSDSQRAATPLDFVPEQLHNPEQTDLVEALFGYVDEDAKERAVARAGRVAVTDATLLDDPDDVWLTKQGLIPKILATPKPTTFQHYLVQPASQESLLRHYGSPTPDETVIRGHKLYWHKGDVNRAAIEAEDAELRGRAQLPPDDTQHTVIQPVRSGVHFRFDLHFENVAAEELGALLWLLEIAQDDDYRLKLGMAKPLGMGAIRVESDLHLTDRTARYTQLFTDDGDAWATGERDDAQTIWKDAVAAFETWLLKHNAEDSINPHKKDTVAELTRIEMLLALLRWPGPAREETRYLQIEHPQNDNEYRSRPVLPTPLQVMGESAPAPRSSSAPSPSPAPRSASQSQEKRHTGTVKWFNDQKGFGFIKVDGQSKDVFVHYSDIEGGGSGRRSLRENERVSFIIKPAPKGPKAQQVRKL